MHQRALFKLARERLAEWHVGGLVRCRLQLVHQHQLAVFASALFLKDQAALHHLAFKVGGALVCTDAMRGPPHIVGRDGEPAPGLLEAASAPAD